MRYKLIAILISLSATLPASARADTVTTARDQRFAALNLRLAERYVAPRYQRLADRARVTAAALDDLCHTPDEPRLAAARRSFHDLADVWTSIDHLTVGPVAQAFRGERFNHWPERRNAVAKAISASLNKADPAALEPSRFAAASVAAQGLAALERLLFANPLDPVRLTAVESGARRPRCALLTAIGASLVSISADLSGEWRDDLLPALRAGRGHPSYAGSAAEFSRSLLTDFLAAVHKVAYLNLSRALGTRADLARPTLAEQWRSGRATRAASIRLQSAYAMYRIGFSAAVADGDRDVDDRLKMLFETALDATRRLPDSFAGYVDDESRRPRFDAALAAVTELRNRLREDVPRALGVNVGFTSFDGD